MPTGQPFLRAKIILAAAILALAPFVAGSTTAIADSSIVIVIKDHRFDPSEVTVPANERVELIIENHDSTPEEFESQDLRREKIVPGNGKISVFVGPLPPGTYGFVGEFHESSAQGKLIVK